MNQTNPNNSGIRSIASRLVVPSLALVAVGGIAVAYSAGTRAGYLRGISDLSEALGLSSELSIDAIYEYKAETWDALKAGQKAPDFRLADLEGRMHSLSDYRGKVVILNRWETWCAPCRRELPDIDEFAKDYGDSVAVLAVTADQYHGEDWHLHAHDYIAGQKLTNIRVLMDPSGKVIDSYGIKAIPTTVIIDKNGKIVTGGSGIMDFGEGSAVRRTIDKLLSVSI